MVIHLQRHYIYLLHQVNLNLKMLLLIRTYSSQRSGLLMPKFMYIYIGIWWGWRNHKAELAIVQQPLSTKYDMEWNLLLFTTRLLACSVSTKGWRFMKKGLIFLMFLFFYVTARSNAELVTRWSKIDTKVIDSLFCLWHDDFLINDNK